MAAMPDSQTPVTLPVAARHVGRREAAGVLLAVAGEGLLVLLALRGVPAVDLFAGHALVLIACFAILFALRPAGSDLAYSYMIWLLVAISGPAGVLPLLASLPFARGRDEGNAVAAWYERLARAGKPSIVAQTYERIASGRVPRLDTAPPVNFMDVIHSGSLEERQRALGLIARHFHPDYAPVLEAALRSPAPVVRVQAAAVVARVREDLKAKVAALVNGGARDPARALGDAGELRALQDCALLGAPQRALCRETASRLMRETLAQVRDVVSVMPSDRDARHVLEDFLIAEKRFKELRVLRRVSNSIASSMRIVRRRAAMEATV